MKKILALLLAGMLLTLCACTNANIQSNDPGSDDVDTDADKIQYDYQLKAGETAEVYDVVFDKMVTVTVDAASTRNGSNDMRSNIVFDNCVFNGGLTIVGDFHAMVTLGSGCSFGDGTAVVCRESTEGIGKETTLEDNLIKIFVGCEGVDVETESAVGVLSDGPDFILNGITYSKAELAPDTAFLGVYSLYEGSSMSYIKLAIGEDDSVKVLA